MDSSNSSLFSFSENKQLLQNAKLELKKSKRKDYYKILGVPKTANEDEMKKAYRKRALLHHPGRSTYIKIPANFSTLQPILNSSVNHSNSFKHTVFALWFFFIENSP